MRSHLQLEGVIIDFSLEEFCRPWQGWTRACRCYSGNPQMYRRKGSQGGPPVNNSYFHSVTKWLDTNFLSRVKFSNAEHGSKLPLILTFFRRWSGRLPVGLSSWSGRMPEMQGTIWSHLTGGSWNYWHQKGCISYYADLSQWRCLFRQFNLQII